MIEILKRYFDTLPLDQAQRRVFNLPNVITLARLSIIPVLFFLLAAPGQTWSLVIAVTFILVSFTDLLDGYVARRYRIVTTMGKFLDPIADKLVLNTAMILMIPIGRIQAWVVALIVIRDFVVDGIRSIAQAEGFTIPASRLGKQKTLCQVFAISALIIHYPIFGADAHAVGTVILYLALFLSIYSGIDYLAKFYRIIVRKES
ncbi:MAG TPA: CDP-diacylglycerol--glycerol-3-phosphate 3-phosphatidyltransferase [Syntrophales bacterium]|nr:CDP-diacylglycerol--glycerol-3-phosphate 3-phosphatidyltransferase [Syntrophales bacterium]HOM07362.1 CDP-diacylglycerol--glycerol-3-phosphate 3-phosphatidyltransferase [Syntrophales bacterium]HON98933.1 CDP-diacylglycerol--glycerol-3-phosphate 3-phosphatidyltransferase [Syntrophales bacterium]HPC00397.1 CDP-diacylglycerol--glycerol-3-phosphate 3-phosphatidyltransferase [Syntrophales bacterium]HPQ07000.1 CDP-diacylglycerol--glycerol-3-phosphate 3-phosphatidyltransferase [Syntrophales bacteri